MVVEDSRRASMLLPHGAAKWNLPCVPVGKPRFHQCFSAQWLIIKRKSRNRQLRPKVRAPKSGAPAAPKMGNLISPSFSAAFAVHINWFPHLSMHVIIRSSHRREHLKSSDSRESLPFPYQRPSRSSITSVCPQNKPNSSQPSSPQPSRRLYYSQRNY